MQHKLEEGVDYFHSHNKLKLCMGITKKKENNKIIKNKLFILDYKHNTE